VAIPRGSSKREGSFILTTERAKHMTALKSSWSLLEVFLTIGLSSKSTHNHVIFPVAVLIISTCSVPDERFIQSIKKNQTQCIFTEFQISARDNRTNALSSLSNHKNYNSQQSQCQSKCFQQNNILSAKRKVYTLKRRRKTHHSFARFLITVGGVFSFCV
jgi:hypothetical protein